MSIVYQNNVVVGTTQIGTIKPDANGYYEVILGAFNINNSGGAYYPLEPVKDLLLSSSNLMRRIKDRALRSEYGHPRKGAMRPAEFLARVMDILEENTCNHIMKIELDEKRVVDPNTNSTAAVIVGWVYPSGPRGPVLEKQFANPHESVSYSIRSITNDHFNASGTLIKEIKEIVTWDYVNEPGIHLAKKGFSPALEGYAQTYKDIDYCVFDESTILEARAISRQSGIGNESSEKMFDTLLRHGVVDTPYGKMYKARPSAAWAR